MSHRPGRGRVRGVLLVLLLLAGCTDRSDPPAPSGTADAGNATAEAGSGDASPEPRTNATAENATAPPPPANSTARPEMPGPEGEPRRVEETFEVRVTNVPTEAAPDMDCLKIYAGNTTRLLSGNATLTWTGTALAPDLDAAFGSPFGVERVEASGPSPLALALPAMTLPTASPPPPGFASPVTLSSAFLRVSVPQGSVMPAATVSLAFEADVVGGLLTFEVGGCPGTT